MTRSANGAGINSAGCCVSVEHARTGELRQLHRPGRKRTALLEIVEIIDAANRRDGDPWRVVGYSTPGTILADLEGRRMRLLDTADGSRTTHGYLPELTVFGQIGRRDLLHRRLLAYGREDGLRLRGAGAAL